MLISELIAPDRVVCHVTATSKKRALEKMSNILAVGQPGVTETLIFDKLMERERLGSTGLGGGVAIPHCRLSGLSQAIVSLITLTESIDFESLDDKPVDIVFALLVPENCTEAHLKILAEAAEMFNDTEFCNLLRTSGSSQELYNLLRNRHPKSPPV